MAGYTNLNDFLGGQQVNLSDPLSAIYNRNMSGITPMDQIALNAEATKRGRAMADEALKQSQLANQTSDLNIQRLQAELPRYDAETKAKIAEFLGKAQTTPLQTELDLKKLQYQNTPGFQSRVNQLLQEDVLAEIADRNKRQILGQTDVPITWPDGSQTILPVGEAAKYRAQLVGLEQKRDAAANKGATGRPTDLVSMTQWIKDNNPELSMDEAGALAAQRLGKVTPEQRATVEANKSADKNWLETNKTRILMASLKQKKTPEDIQLLQEAAARSQRSELPLPTQPAQQQAAPAPSGNQWKVIR